MQIDRNLRSAKAAQRHALLKAHGHEVAVAQER
jgi:hypothetical protein